jgi:hypothetical protein
MGEVFRRLRDDGEPFRFSRSGFDQLMMATAQKREVCGLQAEP